MTTTAPFVIFGLPRSRTYWLSRFLTYGDWVCGHDEARHVRGLDDVKSWLVQDCVGTVETAAAPYWRLLAAMRPDARVVVVRRPVDAVVDSLMATGIMFDRAILTRRIQRLNGKLDQITRRLPNVLSVQFADLAREETCATVFEHCLQYRHDPAWWASIAPVNLQVNLRALLRHAIAHGKQLRLAESVCKQEIRALMWRGQRVEGLDGMTFQEEPFETVWRDAKRLFAQHCSDVGELSDEFTRKNITLLRRLDSLGMMQIMTARSNGRIFGYLVTILGPSLEDADLRVATQTTFYGSPDASGVGLRLQRASVLALQARGGKWNVIQRAGVRGSGARMGALYRRMGAEEYGHLYKISLQGA